MGLSSKQVSSDHLDFNWSTTTQNMITQSSSNQQQQQQQQRSTQTKRSLQTATQQQSTDPLNCPRCDSTNTKFCYYNNYNKTQPRHYCKACKRHWTKGGTLRNVPVGGNGRKNKRMKRAATTTTTTVDHFRDQKYMMFPADDDSKGNMFFKPSEFDQASSWDFNMQQSSSTHQNLAFSVLHQDLTTSNIIDHHTNQPAISIINPATSFAPLILSDHDSTRLMMIPDSSSSHEAAAYMQVPTTTSNFLEPSYWSWNDIDSMVQADLNKPCL